MQLDIGDRNYIFSRLSREQRIDLFNQWELLDAKYEIPEDRAVSFKDQRARQIIRPIKFSPINNLLDFLGMSEFKLSIPKTTEELLQSQSDRKKAIKAAFKKIKLCLLEGNAETRSDLGRLIDVAYIYLAEEDFSFNNADIAVVPGYRQIYRAQKAGELYVSGKVRKLYLTGNRPFYDKSAEPQLSEALAMEIYLTDIEYPESIDRDDIYVDLLAEDTSQNYLYSLVPLQEERKLLGRKIDLVIVTSPYHLRRTHMLFSQINDIQPNLINRIFKIGAETKFDRMNWFKSESGIAAYFTEYWKLQSSRVVGEM